MSYLQNIDAITGDNLGSLLDLRVARVADVESIPAPSNGVIYGDIALKSGKGWASWRVTRNTPRHRTTPRNAMEGEYESASLEFTMAQDRPFVRNMLRQSQGDEHIVLYKDANGKWKVFGSISEPVRFRYSHDSGSAIAQRNAYSCEFYADGASNSWFYNGEIAVAPAGALPAIVRKGDGTILASLQPGQTFVITSGFSFGFRIE